MSIVLAPPRTVIFPADSFLQAGSHFRSLFAGLPALGYLLHVAFSSLVSFHFEAPLFAQHTVVLINMLLLLLICARERG